MSENLLRTIDGGQNWHIFALGLFFAAADAFGIGSNDVANSFATSVGSGSLTLRSACVIAIFTEFIGAVALGDGVTKTIKGSIIRLDAFNGQADTLALAMLCALVGSSIWVNNASRLGMAVSTSHSIVGATVGVGIAFRGPGTVLWGDASHGVISVIFSWLVSPLIAGVLGAIFFTVTKFAVLKAPDPHQRMRRLLPAYLGCTFAVVIFFMALVGGVPVTAPRLGLSHKTDTGAKAFNDVGAILGLTIAGALVVAVAVFYLQRTARFERYVESLPLGEPVLGADGGGREMESIRLVEEHGGEEGGSAVASPDGADGAGAAVAEEEGVKGARDAPKKGARLKSMLLSGVDVDVVTPQSEAAQRAHDLAVRYDPHAERLFTAAQVFTASFASLAHGSNDVANAIAPLSVIQWVFIHGGGKVTSSMPTPLWCLAYGGLFIDLGLALMGYRVMRSLGNNITFHSPSRGFSMELAALVTVLFASATGTSVSTTHCICGATVGVGLCTGDWRAINWRMVAWTILGWMVTLPAAGVSAGLLFAFIAHSPKALSPADLAALAAGQQAGNNKSMASLLVACNATLGTGHR